MFIYFSCFLFLLSKVVALPSPSSSFGDTVSLYFTISFQFSFCVFPDTAPHIESGLGMQPFTPATANLNMNNPLWCVILLFMSFKLDFHLSFSAVYIQLILFSKRDTGQWPFPDCGSFGGQ
jgi:hypothetical protein